MSTYFKIYYTYEGAGIAEVQAKTEEEAREKFFNSEATYDIGNESQSNEQISTIEKIEE